MRSTAPIAASAIRFTARRSMTLRRSSGQAFVLTGADEPDLLTAYRTRHGLGLQVAGLSEHLDEAKRLTILGIGICFLPEAFAAPDVEAGRLWPLLRHAEQPCMPVFVITNPRAPRKLARQLLLAEIGVPGEGRIEAPNSITRAHNLAALPRSAALIVINAAQLRIWSVFAYGWPGALFPKRLDTRGTFDMAGRKKGRPRPRASARAQSFARR